MDHKQIAQIILQQLGAGRFKIMTGARDFLALPAKDGIRGGLSFRLPSRFASNGINYVKVVLTGADTYNLEFAKIGPQPSLKQLVAGKSQKTTVIATHEDIYADQLQSVFTRVTGLDTRL